MSFALEDIHLALNYFALFLILFRYTFSMDESSGFFTALLRFKGLQSSFFSMLLLSLPMGRNAMNVKYYLSHFSRSTSHVSVYFRFYVQRRHSIFLL